MILGFLNSLGTGEVFFILLVVLLLFGSKSIPSMAKGLGKGMREIQNASNEIKRDIQNSVLDIKREANISKTMIQDIENEEKPKVVEKKAEEIPKVTEPIAKESNDESIEEA